MRANVVQSVQVVLKGQFVPYVAKKSIAMARVAETENAPSAKDGRIVEIADGRSNAITAHGSWAGNVRIVPSFPPAVLHRVSC